MPAMPSGRRIEFSLDRFHAMLEMLPESQVAVLGESLREPDDLLWVLDLVTFDAVGRPHFAECVAADWPQVAADWSCADRDAFAAYMRSTAAHECFEVGLEGTRRLLLERLQPTPTAPAERRLVA